MKKSKKTESMADFFRNTGPSDLLNDKSNQKHPIQAKSKPSGPFIEPNPNKSPAKSNKSAIIIDSDEEDELKIKKESSMAEFLKNTSPDNYMNRNQKVTIASQKKFFGFGPPNSANVKKDSSKVSLNVPSSSMNSSSSSKVSLNESQNRSQTSLVSQNLLNEKKKFAKSSPLSKESQKIKTSDESINQKTEESILKPNKITSDTQMHIMDIKGDETSQTGSASLKIPVTKVGTSSLLQVPTIDAPASNSMYSKNNTNYLSADSFAALPVLGIKEVSTVASVSPARIPPTLIPLPSPTLVLSKAVKELIAVDKEYRKVFVAPSEQELPAIVKKVKVFVSFGCQTREFHITDLTKNLSGLKLSEVDDELYNQAITTESNTKKETPEMVDLQSNIPNETVHAEITLETEPLATTRNMDEFKEQPIVSESYDISNIRKESEFEKEPVLDKVFESLATQELMDKIEKLTQENESLRIDLSKEREKREKVDVDRKVMHYQYDKLIRLTHRKVVVGVNNVKQLEYEIRLLQDKLL